MRGQFRFWPGTKKELIVPNNLLVQGEEAFIRMITQADNSDVAGGGNFYVGLSGLSFEEDFTLADIIGEPDPVNNYSRQPASRDSTGWPTIDLVGGFRRAATQVLEFEAIGGDFSTSVSRAFLCNVAAGSAGLLFSISGALPSPLLISPGAPVPVRYELFLR